MSYYSLFDSTSSHHFASRHRCCPTSYSHSLCDIARHYGPTPYVPAPNLPTISLLSQTAATEHALPVHTSPRPTNASPPSALRDIPPAATLSCPLEGTTLKDVVTPCAEPDASEILSTASTPAPTLTPGPVPESTPRVPNETSTSCDADAASLSNLLPPASSVVGSSFPASSPPSRVSPLPNAELLALLDGTTPSGPSGNAALPHLRARGLVNNGSMCFANAVLQLLVYSPPFWNLVWQLEDLKGRRGGGLESGGCATTLVDAMMRFFDEFVFRDKELPPTQQTLQQPDTTKAKAKEDEVEKKDNKINKIMDSFEPTYLYEAMKEKRQLKHLLDGKHEDAEEFLGLYLDALDRELVELQTYIRTHKPASVPNIEEFEGEVAEAKSAEGQTEVGKRDYTASSIESPISRIFGGRSRSTVREPSQPDTVAIEAWRSLKLYIQPDSVHTIQDALALVSQPQPVQVGPSSSSDASQEVLLEALPPVLVLHLERFLYDAAADGIIRSASQFSSPRSSKSHQKSWLPFPGILRSQCTIGSVGYFTITARLQAAGTILLTCSTRTEIAVVGRVGCTLTMKL
ncbi:hypothetical protein BJV77DRAFT_222625 [Russula vinacea]|nr:hypothetical protein BJV77DRAFT_222625 [Russula vinacea]